MNPQPLYDWINERHAIYLRRAAGQPPPWTVDPILREYRFTNVFRELDAVTVWIRENIREPFADHPDLWFMMAIARQINWPETLQELIDCGVWPEKSWSWEHFRDVMRDRSARGEKVYTGAYMLRGPIQGDPSGSQDKPNYTALRVLEPVWADRVKLRPWMKLRLQDACAALEAYHGWGGFLAYEVATDLRHCPGWLDKAPDIMTWANPGPGALRGLNRLYGRPVKQALNREQAITEMQLLLLMSLLYLGSHVPALEMRDIEHSLCECDKYLRVKLGEGRPRAKYDYRSE